MTKSQIKADLRRSAMGDELPYSYISNLAFYAAAEYCVLGQSISDLDDNSIRIFFLLVAESI